MTEVVSRVAGRAAGDSHHYLSEFERLQQGLPGHSLAWVRALRRGALARFAELDFPTVKHEDWKYTNVAPITRLPFRPAVRPVAGRAETRLGSPGARDTDFTLPAVEAGSARLVFVDGHLAPEWSLPGTLPASVVVVGLAECLAAGSGRAFEQLEQHLGRHADHDRHAFTALNTAFFADGAVVLVPAGTEVLTPIHLVHVATRQGTPTVSHLRHLVAAGEGSTVTIVERYMAAGKPLPRDDAPPSFTNAVTEIAAGPGSRLAHYRLEQESHADFHVGMLGSRLARDSNVSAWSIATGAALARIEVRALLDGEGAGCWLGGLYLLGGAQHVDHQTVVDHARPHGSSQQLYKGIMDGASRGVFTGRILVREGAQKTDAHQTSRSLVLSPEALAEARPQLEIRTNDVACTHGVAIGRLDEDMLFYLRARGIAEREARRLLAAAFAAEVLDTILLPELRSELDRKLTDWLAREPAPASAPGERAQDEHAPARIATRPAGTVR